MRRRLQYQRWRASCPRTGTPAPPPREPWKPGRLVRQTGPPKGQPQWQRRGRTVSACRRSTSWLFWDAAGALRQGLLAPCAACLARVAVVVALGTPTAR